MWTMKHVSSTENGFKSSNSLQQLLYGVCFCRMVGNYHGYITYLHLFQDELVFYCTCSISSNTENYLQLASLNLAPIIVLKGKLRPARIRLSKTCLQNWTSTYYAANNQVNQYPSVAHRNIKIMCQRKPYKIRDGVNSGSPQWQVTISTSGTVIWHGSGYIACCRNTLWVWQCQPSGDSA